MNCRQIESHVTDFLTGRLDPATFRAVQDHLLECGACREELEHLSELWADLEIAVDAKPSPAVRSRFYSMLRAEKPEPVACLPRDRQGRRVLLQAAAALLLVTGGWFMGRTFGGDRQPKGVNAGLLDPALESSLREEIDLALKKPATSKRMLGVALISRLPKADTTLAGPLLDLLAQDPSPQVRLAALDALSRYVDQPWVRERIIEALFQQDSPKVQVAMLGLLSGFRDRTAAEAVESLVRQPWIAPEVRETALASLSSGPLKSL